MKSKYILIFLSISFIIRSIVPISSVLINNDLSVFYTPDSYSYLSSAQELFLYGSFTTKGIPEIFRTPGYPIFLLLGIYLDYIIFTTILLQVIINTISVYLVYEMAMMIYKDYNISLICALLFIADPLSITYSSLILSETLYTFCILLFIINFYKYFETNKIVYLIIAAIVLSISTYIRPISYFMPLIIFIIIVIFKFIDKKYRSLYHAAILLIISVGIIYVWQIRNNLEADYNGFSAVSDYNLYYYQGAATLAKKDGVSIEEMQQKMKKDEIDKNLIKYTGEMPVIQGPIYNRLGKEGLKIIWKYPSVYLMIHLKSMLNILLSHGALDFLSLYGISPNTTSLGAISMGKGFSPMFSFLKTFLYREKKIIVIYTILFELIILTNICMASYTIYRFNKVKCVRLILISLIILCYFLILSGGPSACFRFRHPIMPIINILAGYGIYSLFKGNRLPLIEAA